MRWLQKTAAAKFDETVEAACKTWALTPRHADQQVRGAVVLPHGTGRSQTVYWCLQKAKKHRQPRHAGAEYVGD